MLLGMGIGSRDGCGRLLWRFRDGCGAVMVVFLVLCV